MSEKKIKAERKVGVLELEERRKHMEFTALERVVLLGMLPNRTSYLNIKKSREVAEELGFSDLEQKIFGTVNAPTAWHVKGILNKAIKSKRIDLGDYITQHIKNVLEQLYKQEQLSDIQVDLYDKLVGPIQNSS